jgi:8-oxo-dGTP pyrophosphatase MutT (NUDIX family)
MAVDPEAADVKAAGGVVLRHGAHGPLVAVVHRPRYDDWSFPKGKLDPGESWEEAALREVREEIGLVARLGDELPPVSYDVAGGERSGDEGAARGRKVVRYWLMEPESGEFTPNEEVDEVRWLSPAEAERLLTYDHDRALAREVPA